MKALMDGLYVFGHLLSSLFQLVHSGCLALLFSRYHQ